MSKRNFHHKVENMKQKFFANHGLNQSACEQLGPGCYKIPTVVFQDCKKVSYFENSCPFFKQSCPSLVWLPFFFSKDFYDHLMCHKVCQKQLKIAHSFNPFLPKTDANRFYSV